MKIAILDFIHGRPRATDHDRARAQARVESERVSLRECLLLRDRAEYERQLGPRGKGLADFSIEEIALLDLDIDPFCAALRMATPDERAGFDRAVWEGVSVNLWLLGKIKLRSCGDPLLDEAHALDGLRDSIERWDPSRGRLGTILGWQILKHQRRYLRERARYDQPTEERPLEVVEVEEQSDPILLDRLRRVELRLTDDERATLRAMVEKGSGVYAREEGVSRVTAKRRFAALRGKIRETLDRQESMAARRRQAWREGRLPGQAGVA